MEYKYIGIFFSSDELYSKVKSIGERLSEPIKHPHITFIYKPGEVDETIFGQEVEAYITGYGNNGENEGLSVEIRTENEKILKLFENIEVPHITLSISETGKAVNTRFLEFKPIIPFIIKGKFGGYKYNNLVVVD